LNFPQLVDGWPFWFISFYLVYLRFLQTHYQLSQMFHFFPDFSKTQMCPPKLPIKAKSNTLSPMLKFFSSRDASPVGKIFFPNSPCPSPTPIFQQLYMALAHFERLSPDMVKLMPKHDDRKLLQRSSSYDSLSNDEHSSETIRRQSYPLGKPYSRIISDKKS
jgi:hypothetical protein